MTVNLPVNLGERSYDIVIGDHLLDSSGDYLPESCKNSRMFIVTDENVGPYFEARLRIALQPYAAEEVKTYVLPPGEQTKSFGALEKLCLWLLESDADRRSVIFALGGGVIGDLAGFAAAITMRGIRYAQVPTTLLAQIDSSIGGKTAIDAPQGKNLVGAFHQPVLVLSDVDVLRTLPDRELKAGYFEGLKHAVIRDAKLFKWLEENREAIFRCEPDALAFFVERSCRIKAEIVEEDEVEHGVRALLNFGHTFGHAVEAACGYDGRILHGEAVAIGMVCASELSFMLDHCAWEDVETLRRHLAESGLPVSIGQINLPEGVTAENLYERMKGDKKSVSGEIKFILTRGIGDAFLGGAVEERLVLEVLEKSMNTA